VSLKLRWQKHELKAVLSVPQCNFIKSNVMLPRRDSKSKSLGIVITVWTSAAVNNHNQQFYHTMIIQHEQYCTYMHITHIAHTYTPYKQH